MHQGGSRRSLKANFKSRPFPPKKALVTPLRFHDVRLAAEPVNIPDDAMCKGKGKPQRSGKGHGDDVAETWTGDPGWAAQEGTATDG